MNEITEELIAIGAAIGAHCQPCLEYHLQKAQDLDIPPEDIRQAVEVGHRVGKGSMNAMKKFSSEALEKLLSADPTSTPAP